MTRISGDISIRPVEGKAMWQAFHMLPHTLYRHDPNWVAPLLIERKIHFDPSHNPFFKHAEAAFWLAYRDEVPVGRITAQIDALHLERYQDASGHFGFIEAIDDQAVFDALLDTAEAWLKGKGMRRAIGPISFSLWDEAGLLVDGFDRPPSVMMGHALPYYQTRIEAHGYAKAQDLIAYDYELGRPQSAAMTKIITRSTKDHSVTYRPIRMDKKNFVAEVEMLLDILNDAWSGNWGFVPMTQAEIDDLAQVFKLLLKPDAFVIAEVGGVPAGFSMIIPNLNEAVRDLKGRLLPTGIFKLLWRLKVSGTRSIRMALMGIRKEWQNSPVGAGLALSMIARAEAAQIRYGVTRAELSWVLDVNERLKHLLTIVGGTVYKRYRIYDKALT